MENNNPIFIVGMPRSGTTLMRSLLSAHPRLIIAPETHFLNDWVEKHHHLDLHRDDEFVIFWERFSTSEQFSYLGIEAEAVLDRIYKKGPPDFRAVFEAVLQEYAYENEKPRWGEKTPAHYDYVDILLSWYPDSRIIWMIRDPRAVCASHMKVPWSSKYIISPARRWVKSMRELERWDQESRVKTVRYEDLVRNQVATMTEIFAFLEEQPTDVSAMLQRRNQMEITRELHKGWSRQHFYAASQPVHAQSLQKWQKLLKYDQVRLIEYVARREMLLGNYGQTTTWNSILMKIRLFMANIEYVLMLAKHKRIKSVLQYRIRQYLK